MKILFIQLGRIGDMVLLTPLFKAVKDKYPDSRIDILASRRNNIVIQNNPHLNEIIIYEKSPVKLFKTIKKIRKNYYDFLIDPKDHYSRESRILAKFVKAKTKIGFNSIGSHLYDISIPPDKENADLHCTERFFNALRPLSITIGPEIPKPELFTSLDSDNYVEKYLNENNIELFKLINISATTKDRMFSSSKWISILKNLVSHKNFVISYAPTEKILVQEIKSALPHLKIFQSRSFNDVISLVKRSSMIITVDTALVHIASGFNTPIISFHIGNNEQIKKYYPLSDVSNVMESPSSDAGIESIRTEEIINKLEEFFSNKSIRKS